MNDLAKAIANPTEIWMTVLTLLFSALCVVLWSWWQAQKKETEQRWANNEKILEEMRKEWKEIANVAYEAKANSTIIEERRKNVEEKLDALMATNHQLVARIDALIMEMAAVKTAVAVNEAKQQASGTRRRSTNN
jgi:chromosome segregation ATPase